MLVKTYNYISNSNQNIFSSLTGPRIVYESVWWREQLKQFPENISQVNLSQNHDFTFLFQSTFYVDGCIIIHRQPLLVLDKRVGHDAEIDLPSRGLVPYYLYSVGGI